MPTRTFDPTAPISGHVFLYEGARRSTWVAKWRDHTGQHEKRLGPAWSGKGAPIPGTYRKREAQAALEELLVEARRGARQQGRTGVTFADVAEDWFEHGKFERDWSASTQVDYRSVLDAHLIKAFGTQRIESITSEQIQTWRDKFAKETNDDGEPKRARKTVNKIVVQMHAIFEHAIEHHGLVVNPVARVKRLRESNDPARFDFFSPEEIDLLVATAAAGLHRDPGRPAVSETEAALRSFEDEQDAAIYLTAALSGLRRGELLALRWADIDFEQSSIRVYEGYSANTTGKTKSRKSRTVPMIDKVAERLTQIKQRPYLTANTHLVFVSRERTNVDGSALRRRYIATLDAAGLRRLRFHDLRHTFGSLAINVASIVQVQAWMGHADIKTTMRYLHHKSRADDARLLSAAFQPEARRRRPSDGAPRSKRQPATA
jgi:integrase